MNDKWMRAFACTAAISLSACTLPGARGDVVLYSPAVVRTPARAAANLRLQIAVLEPQALGPLSGTRMLVSPRPGQLVAYRQARWQAPPSVLIQGLLVQGLHDIGVAGVAGNGTVMRADYLIESDLRSFQSEYRGNKNPTVVLRLATRLIRNADGQVVAARDFEVEEPATDINVEVVSAAFGRGIQRLIQDVSDWAVSTLDTAAQH